MDRRYVTLLILALVINVVGAATVSCEKIGEFTWSSPAYASVVFEFSALAPLGLGEGAFWLVGPSSTTIWGVQFYNTSHVVMASYAKSWEWDRELTYNVKLRYFDPDGKWTVERYKCTYTYRYGNVTFVDTGYYYKVAAEPTTIEEIVTFTIPRLWSSLTYKNIKSVKVGRSIAEDYWNVRGVWNLCYSLPDVYTWPRCAVEYRKLNVVAAGSTPELWRALQISGVGEGQLVSNGYVNITTPRPWYYTDRGLYNDLGLSTAMLTTDVSSDPAYVGSVDNKPFSTRVSINVVAVPSRWGTVEARPPPPVPLYMSRVVLFNDVGQCNPPNCFVINTVGNSTWVGDRWVWNGTLASVAVHTGIYLNPVAVLRTPGVNMPLVSASGVVARVPYGTLLGLEVSVMWWTEVGGRRTWVNTFPTARLVVVDKGGNNLADFYESAAAAGKLWYKMSPGSLYTYYTPGVKWETFYAAVDQSQPYVITAWYAPPDPCRQWPKQMVSCVYSQHVFTKINGTWVGYAKVGPRGGAQQHITKLELVDWLMPYAFLNHKLTDILAYLGHPHLLLWHTYRVISWAFNPQTGDFDTPIQAEVQGPHKVTLLNFAVGNSQYRNTTDVRGRKYQQISALPDWYYNYAFVGVSGDELPGGWADLMPLGLSSMPSNSTSHWTVFLVPTTACASLICPSLDPILWGPAPGPTANLALPGAGYSFLVVYLGRENKTTIRVYVEAGYVVNEKRGVVSYWFGKNIYLDEVSKTWRFLDGVYVGPGWHLDYKPLAACESIKTGVKSIYVTPSNYTGPLRLIIEEVETGRRHYFVFFVGAEAQLRISSTSAVPDAFTTPQLNTTAYFYLNGAPYFHGLPGFGEGGRQYAFKCLPVAVKALSFLGASGLVSQLVVTGEFRGELDLWTSVFIRDAVAKPAFELVDANKSLVKIMLADPNAPVVGYAFYLMRNGTWRKVAEVNASCVVVNASSIMPWDPVLILPVVTQSAWARGNDVVFLWRPEPKLLFKAWAKEPWLPYTQFDQTRLQPCSR